MIIGVIVGYGVIRGLFRGFIRELAAIAGVAAGFYVAYVHYQTISPRLMHWIHHSAYANIIAFILLFCAVVMIFAGAGMILRLIMKVALLGIVDRVLGAIFGGLKGALIVSLLFILLVSFLPAGGAKILSDSKLSPYVNTVSKAMVMMIPKDMGESFKKNIEALKKK